MLASVETNQRTDREFRFEKSDFDYLADLVRRNTGIVLADHKQDMVYSRLVRRLRELGLSTFKAYCELLEQPGGSAELGKLINAITTNLTRFFREGHHFEHLAQTTRDHLAKTRGRSRFRIWSAGCSSGEEPYSIAMTMGEYCEALRHHDFRILASDLDTDMVARGSAGRYMLKDADGLSKGQVTRWTTPVRGTGEIQMKPALREMIVFKQLNLLGPWPMRGKFNVIFCRNVMIYFDGPTKARLLERYHDALVPGGWLYIGHSETILEQRHLFEPMGKTIYRKAGPC